MERLLGGAMRGNHVEGPRELPETAQAFVKGCGSCPWWGLALPRFAGDICHGAVMAGEEPGWSTHACPAPPEAGYHGGAWGRGRFSRTLSFQFRCAAIFGWDWQKAVLPTCTRQCFCASEGARKWGSEAGVKAQGTPGAFPQASGLLCSSQTFYRVQPHDQHCLIPFQGGDSEGCRQPSLGGRHMPGAVLGLPRAVGDVDPRFQEPWLPCDSVASQWPEGTSIRLLGARVCVPGGGT
ncbi:uncharacterized protein LOC106557825 isoform X7 [Canis lupus familiaris]|uniref:uncharacterized protein LOC106557825 isoform X7 n=1 Tax=Canis lupus familiaris TaxID=9615 RepID=UPI000BAA1C1A|nr:uncharacterized protein LOC106557825 isoform X7 [Canis lupus familiaris]XP_038292223.1 uncharacterized protein LOC106557825 isoform X7 [Canis lupus familiaris]XP_038430601.1 uncharacterized protein LOC106557825 isoform X7 [Canis lupus familiaris]|eukprot:XP_022266245.1 uncharacterized protein LOC106557825 isoform X6 [Canis lupus familiaris]